MPTRSVDLGFFWKDDGKTRNFNSRQQGFESCFCHLNNRASFSLCRMGTIRCLVGKSFFWEGSPFWIFCRLPGGVKIFACGHFPRKKLGCIASCYSPKGPSLSPSCFDSGIKLGVRFSVCLVWELGEGLPRHLQKSEFCGFLGLCRRCGEHGLSK